VLEDRVGHAGRAARALAPGPAVVGAGLELVDLFDRVLSDVVDEDPAAVRVDRDPERVTEAVRVDLLALAGTDPAVLARRRTGTAERVAARDATGGGDPQDLAVQVLQVLGGVVGRVAPFEAVAVADAHVQVAVVTEGEVAGVVEAVTLDV